MRSSSEVPGTKLKKRTYGTGRGKFRVGQNVDSMPFLRVMARLSGAELEVDTQLVGGYNLENVLAAIAVGHFFGVDPQLIRSAIANYSPSNNRSQYIKRGSNEIIMDAYNANPGSMQASITNFLTLPHPRKLFLLGDMLELGEASAAEHQLIVDNLSHQVTDGVFLCGPIFQNTQRPPGFLSFPDTAALAEFLRLNLPEESLILIKGSRGMQLEKLIDLFG